MENNTLDYEKLINQRCNRKGSKNIWEIWAANDNGIALMNVSKIGSIVRRVTIENFIKYWEIN